MPLRVVPARLDWLIALLESDAVFVQRFGVLVEPGWIGFPEALPFAVDAARNDEGNPWGPHLFFDDDGALVGFGDSKELRPKVELRSVMPSLRHGKAAGSPPLRPDG